MTATQASKASKAGLCATCSHARVIRSVRDSVFMLCGLANVDPEYSRYPWIPVLRCDGYTANNIGKTDTDGDKLGGEG